MRRKVEHFRKFQRVVVKLIENQGRSNRHSQHEGYDFFSDKANLMIDNIKTTTISVN